MIIFLSEKREKQGLKNRLYNYTILCYAMPCHAILLQCHTIPYYYYTIPYLTILLAYYYHTIAIPYHTVPYNTITYYSYTIPYYYYTIPYYYYIISYLIILLPYNIISCYRTNKNTHGRQGNLRFLISPSDHLKNAAVVSRSCFQWCP